MNQKYLFALLVFFFLIHVEKTYGLCGSGHCLPSGEQCGVNKPKDPKSYQRMLIFKQFLIYYYSQLFG